jgi:hypothetical protein
MNQSTPLASTPIPFDLAVFPATDDSVDSPMPLNFAPGSS